MIKQSSTGQTWTEESLTWIFMPCKITSGAPASYIVLLLVGLRKLRAAMAVQPALTSPAEVCNYNTTHYKMRRYETS